MNNHYQSWKLIPKKISVNLRKATEQLHHAAQFLAATGHSFLSHQEDDAHTNLAWRQGLGLQSRPFYLDQQYTLNLNYELFQLELQDALGVTVIFVTLDQKTRKEVLEILQAVFSERSNEESGVFESIQHYELPDHPLKHGAPFQQGPEESLDALRLFRDNAQVLISSINQGFEEASEMRIWPHHFDNGSICVVERNTDNEMTKTVGWGFSIPNDTDSEHHFYINHWSKETQEAPGTLAELPEGAYWSEQKKLMAILPIRALQARPTRAAQAQLAQAFFEEGIKAARAIIKA